MSHYTLSFAAKGYLRRLRFHWPLWLSTVGAVGLVAIGSGLPNTLQNLTPMGSLNPIKAAMVLQTCAIIVAMIQVSIMSARALLADTPYFHVLFSIGTTPLEIAVLRGSEMLIGCVLATLAGLCLGILILIQIFGLPATSIAACGVIWATMVGMVPMAVVVFVPRLASSSY